MLRHGGFGVELRRWRMRLGRQRWKSGVGVGNQCDQDVKDGKRVLDVATDADDAGIDTRESGAEGGGSTYQLPQPSSTSSSTSPSNWPWPPLNRLSHIPHTLNTLSGYTSIASLKQRVHLLETSYLTAQRDLDNTRLLHDRATATLSSTQRSLNALLQRQSSWTPSDLATFTTLFKQEHDLSAEIKKNKEKVDEALKQVETKRLEWMNGIGERYQEEQVWRDKIRYASTVWTWVLVGVNLVTVVAVQVGIEPRRRAMILERMGTIVRESQEVIGSRLNKLEEVMAMSRPADMVAAQGERLESLSQDDGDDKHLEPQDPKPNQPCAGAVLAPLPLFDEPISIPIPQISLAAVSALLPTFLSEKPPDPPSTLFTITWIPTVSKSFALGLGTGTLVTTIYIMAQVWTAG